MIAEGAGVKGRVYVSRVSDGCGTIRGMTSRRPPLGSREWHEQFRREQARFDRAWPWMVALAVIVSAVTIYLVVIGVLPVSVLFEG